MSRQNLTAAELDERWKVTPGWIYAQVRRGELTTIPLPGKYVRFRLDVIEEFEKSDRNQKEVA